MCNIVQAQIDPFGIYYVAEFTVLEARDRPPDRPPAPRHLPLGRPLRLRRVHPSTSHSPAAATSRCAPQDVFNWCFLIELSLNMYGHWCKPFWKSGWNVFDVIVVTVGLLNMLRLALPGPLRLLRMMRAFRVFRLFKRIKSLNKIIVSLVKVSRRPPCPRHVDPQPSPQP